MVREVWRSVQEAPGYKVSNLGRVKGKQGQIMSPQVVRWSPCASRRCSTYLKVGLMVNGERLWRFVHRLVLLAFRGSPPEGYDDCCHKNHDSHDNRVVNLAWGSHLMNCRDSRTLEAEQRRATRDEGRGRLHYQETPGVPF